MILLSSLTNCPSPVKKVEQTSTIVVQLSAVAMSRQHTIFRLSKQVCLVDFGQVHGSQIFADEAFALGTVTQSTLSKTKENFCYFVQHKLQQLPSTLAETLPFVSSLNTTCLVLTVTLASHELELL